MILLDVGENTLNPSGDKNETFLSRAKACVSKIIQRKIFTKPNDEIGLVLMGCDDTQNDLNSSLEGYENIAEVIPLSIPRWEMLRTLEKIEASDTASSDWVDGLVVALNYLKIQAEGKKFAHTRIVLITNFLVMASDSNIDVIISTIGDCDIELVAISDNVVYLKETDACQFSQAPTKSQIQTSSEKLLANLMTKVYGNLSHIDYAELQLLHFQKQNKAMPWNCPLTIGSELKIRASVFVNITEEKFLKSFKTTCNEKETFTKFVTEYKQNNNVIEFDPENVIESYMYGSTVVAMLDEVVEVKANKSFMCIGFTPAEYIRYEYMCGDGNHVVLPQENYEKCEKLFATLVKAMYDSNQYMVVRRVYNLGGRPTLYVLIPNYHDKYPYFTMNQLTFAEDSLSLVFPKLTRKKTQPSDEQLASMESLIKSMDLMNALDHESGLTEAFALGKSLNPVNQHLCRSVAFRALNPAEPLPPISDELMDMIEVPKKIKEQSKDILEEMKKLFPLEVVEKKTVRKLFGKSTDAGAATQVGNTQDITSPDVDDGSKIVAVGSVTPAEDFGILIDKGVKFSILSSQIQSVIYDLIFRTTTLSMQKIIEAILMYREQAKIYGPLAFNKWIRELKDSLLTKNRMDLFESIMVKEGLGLLSREENAISDVDQMEQIGFFDVVVKKTNPNTSMDQDDEDNLDALLNDD
ncbi:unnamed protein product [Diamesa hyperborea]